MNTINALASNIPPAIIAWNQIILYLGALMVGLSLLGFMSTRNDPQRGLLVVSQLKQFLFGGVLLSITFYIEMASVSVFEDSAEARSIFSYQPTTNADSLKAAADLAINLIRATGIFCFGKSLFMGYDRLKNKPDATWPKVVVMFVFSVALMNILKTGDSMASSAGMQNFLRDLL